MIQVPLLQALPWLRHGFSTRRGGVSTAYNADLPVLNLGFTAHDNPTHVARNRADFLHQVAGDVPAVLLTVRQVHGTVLNVVRSGDSRLMNATPPEGAPEADGLLTAVPGAMLGVQAADCVPILLADRRRRAVAAVHAGWRGTVAGIIGRAVQRMRQEYDSDPADLLAAIGPAIGACCYIVGTEVRDQFEAGFPGADHFFHQSSDGLHLDLAQANRRQLLAAGLLPEAISAVAECTACTRIDGRRKYFSHRAENGFTGRAMGVIGVVAAAP